jgi:hypothetical protein
VYTMRHLPLSRSRSRSPPGARASSVACARAASASSAGEATHPRHVPSTARRSARLASSTSEADEEAGDDVSARAALADARGPARARNAGRGATSREVDAGEGGRVPPNAIGRAAREARVAMPKVPRRDAVCDREERSHGIFSLCFHRMSSVK